MSHGRRGPETYNRQAAPRDYVPGLGRGATSFSTRVDVGPLLVGGRGRGRGRGSALGAQTAFGSAPRGYVAGAGRGVGGFGETKPTTNLGEGGDEQGSSGFDNVGSLFANVEYDQGDIEADRVWDAIELRMSERRKRKRPEKAAASSTSSTSASDEKKLRVADQFADLKQQLATVSYEEWDAIPEANTGVRSHKREEGLVPVSDSIILSRSGLDAKGMDANLNVARGRMVRDRLDEGAKASENDTVDVDGYLHGLDSLASRSAGIQVGDLKKARLMFKSMTSSNPKHGPGWVAAARLEESAGKLIDARNIIEQGCLAAPKSEEVWIEAARLNTANNAKVILEKAIHHLPRSVRIWHAAANLETSDKERQKRVLRRALETLPHSEELWKTLISLEEDETDAHLMLTRATECVPGSVELWLALARLEEYDQARQVLNTAKRHNPKEPKIWVAACALEEANYPVGDGLDTNENKDKDKAAGVNVPLPAFGALEEKLNRIMGAAVKTLSSPSNMVVDRATWLAYAMEMESSESVHTCRAIVHASINVGIEDDAGPNVWMEDASKCVASGHTATARALHTEHINRTEARKVALRKAILFETEHGTQETLRALLERAVQINPDVELFWLMAAKELWKTFRDLAGARKYLMSAFDAGHTSERIWLAAFKLEWEEQEIARASKVLEDARAKCGSKQIYLKSALFSRVELSKLERGTEAFEAQLKEARKLVSETCTKFKSFDKAWLMAAELEREYTDKPGSVARARQALLEGIKQCPNSSALWLQAARLEEKAVSAAKARSVLEMARTKNPRSDELWLEAVQLERRSGNESMANSLMSRALQECPTSGELWADNILSAPKPEQRARSADALERCESDPAIFRALGELFARDRKHKAALKWFEKAVSEHPNYGDGWAAFHAYAVHVARDAPLAQDIMDRCVRASPQRGPRWIAMRKRDANRHQPPGRVLQLLSEEYAPSRT